ncbi:MAG: hypothetical protein C6P37_14820 [Caldibacillus debilis]|uniref:Uncharacterized protein n=1 Tax=Caldibacillus debilis TaxID=301148 RepID=A0A3E0JYZ6_9BACI|nr:MAG: hypothetical protein C6P37_14820 [Caldibacillus debilis]
MIIFRPPAVFPAGRETIFGKFFPAPFGRKNGPHRKGGGVTAFRLGGFRGKWGKKPNGRAGGSAAKMRTIACGPTAAENGIPAIGRNHCINFFFFILTASGVTSFPSGS